MSSLERVSDYREFGLERFHCIRENVGLLRCRIIEVSLYIRTYLFLSHL